MAAVASPATADALALLEREEAQGGADGTLLVAKGQLLEHLDRNREAAVAYDDAARSASNDEEKRAAWVFGAELALKRGEPTWWKPPSAQPGPVARWTAESANRSPMRCFGSAVSTRPPPISTSLRRRRVAQPKSIAYAVPPALRRKRPRTRRARCPNCSARPRSIPRRKRSCLPRRQPYRRDIWTSRRATCRGWPMPAGERTAIRRCSA